MTPQQDMAQQWLVRHLQQIREYSGINKTYSMDAELIADVHIDSLELLELIAAIEEYTEQPLRDEVWMKWQRLQDIVDYLVSATTDS
ncbi:acyl carrier protein [Providencia sp. wls1943]|uniref:acyl carrier protein n=1 Tax=Providencia sp. wls1943 TaxID=2675150 RepID=UPI0012B59E0B|nr:acyl carrier protein [Providencia sp. wls1943]MTB65442.1 acyl carrier protein [Providencia sp. wls1943]